MQKAIIKQPLFGVFLALLVGVILFGNYRAQAANYTPPDSKSMIYNFNLDWKFYKGDAPGAQEAPFDDSSWAMVSAPHTFNDIDSFNDLYRKTTSGEPDLYTGVYWYRKHFKLDSTYSGRKVLIEFEGIRQAALVYVNGTLVGQYEAGVTPFGFDITDYVKTGAADNVIAVKGDNSSSYVEQASGSTFEWGSKDFNPNYGGLTRNINLYIMDKTYLTLPLWCNLQTTGTYIYPSDISTSNRTATINIESQVRNDNAANKTVSFQADIVDMNGNLVKTITSEPYTIPAGSTYTFKVSGSMTDVKLWQPGYPYLYKVYNMVKEGQATLGVLPITTGFRKADFRGGAVTGGVYLNNIQSFFPGYAIRSADEWAGLGAAVPDWMHDFDGQLIRQSNGSLIRFMHISAEPVDIRMCDRQGIVVIQPFGDKERDVEGAQWNQRVAVARASMIYFRNDPSILFWEVGNNFVSAAHMKQMHDLKYEIDPHGMRAIGCRAISEDPAYGGPDAVAQCEYIGTMLNRHATPYVRDLMPIMECEYTREEAPRRVWDNYSPPDFDYKHDSTTTYDLNSEEFATTTAVPNYMEFWDGRVMGSGQQYYSGCAALIWADSNQHGRQPNTENCRCSGRVDAVRIPKESFYTYRVMQAAAVNKSDIHIVGHWTYPEKTEKTICVIAAKCAKVELFVNDKSQGSKTSPTTGDFLYSFSHIAWKAGTIKAVGYDKDHKIICQDQIETAGSPAKIKLTVTTGPTGLRANGEDIAMVDVEVVDAAGRRCPTDQARIDFAINGPGKFEGGWNSGVADSIHKSYINTECGVNRVFIRATRTVGKITLTATRNGLTSASVSVTSNEVKVNNGLTVEMPATMSPVLGPVPQYGPDLKFTAAKKDSDSKAASASTQASKNLALNKKVTCSEQQSGNEAAKAVDGNNSSRWAAGGYPQWLVVDLGGNYPIVRTEWTPYKKRAYQYKIEVSKDGKNYTLVADKTANTESSSVLSDNWAAEKARYVRLTITGCSNYTGGWGSASEMRVFAEE